MMPDTPDTLVQSAMPAETQSMPAPPPLVLEPLPAMTTPPPEPTAEQLARREALRRFDRNTIYLPVGIVAFLWIVALLGMFWLSLAGGWFGVETNQGFYRELFFGVANVVVILNICFWMLLLMIPIGLAGYLWSYRRQRIAARPAGPRPLPLFWRIENIIILVRDLVDQVVPKLARPLILAYGLVAYLKTLFNEIKKILHLE